MDSADKRAAESAVRPPDHEQRVIDTFTMRPSAPRKDDKQRSYVIDLRVRVYPNGKIDIEDAHDASRHEIYGNDRGRAMDSALAAFRRLCERGIRMATELRAGASSGSPPSGL